MDPFTPPYIPPGHSALRRNRRSEPGRIYLITFTTHDRRAVFSDFEHACVVAAATTDGRAWPSAVLLAWVLMPDHWHGLVQLGPFDSLDIVVGRLKSVSAKQFNRAMGAKGALWSQAFHDRALRTEADLLPAARYLVANPLRAGLVERIGDYSFWDAVWL
jgi:REP element-mobilizing transposase RayT